MVSNITSKTPRSPFGFSVKFNFCWKIKKARPDLIEIADKIDPMDIGVQSDTSSDCSSNSSSSGGSEDEVEDKTKPTNYDNKNVNGGHKTEPIPLKSSSSDFDRYNNHLINTGIDSPLKK